MSIDKKIKNIVAVIHYNSATLPFELILIAEAPCNADAFHTCISGSLHIDLTVTDVNTFLRRNTEPSESLVNIDGRGLALTLIAYSDCVIDKTGEIIKAKLVNCLMKLV